MDISKYAKREILQLTERPATRTPIPSTGEIINLGAGDPDFNQPPIVAEWIREAIEAGETHYKFQGHPEFKRAVAEYYYKYGVKIDPETQVIPTSGGGTALFLTLAATINPGDEVIIPDPAYQGYINPIKYFGGRIVRAKMRKTEDGYFRPDIQSIEKAATEKTKLMIICNPDNPTGCIYTMQELKEIARIATEKDFLILSDEIYNEFTWLGKNHTAIATIKEAADRTIIAMSLSKTFAWTGLRVGYIIAPKELAELIWRVPIGISPTPVPIQIAAAKMLREGWSFHEEMKREYKKRIEYCVKRLNEIPNMKCVHPEATFYLFPDITETGMKSTEYAKKLFEEEGVRVVAGSTFGEMGEGHIRIALVAPIEKLEEATNRMERLHRKIMK